MDRQKKFQSLLGKSFAQDVHVGKDIVCMNCRRLIKNGDKLNKCCLKLGFEVEPKSVIIDKATGKVTQCSPPEGEH